MMASAARGFRLQPFAASALCRRLLWAQEQKSDRRQDKTCRAKARYTGP
jgi:hypothetical protein